MPQTRRIQKPERTAAVNVARYSRFRKARIRLLLRRLPGEHLAAAVFEYTTNGEAFILRETEFDILAECCKLRTGPEMDRHHAALLSCPDRHVQAVVESLTAFALTYACTFRNLMPIGNCSCDICAELFEGLEKRFN